MSLIAGALSTVTNLLMSMGKSQADILIPFFSVYNSSADATSATVTKTGTTLTMTVVGGVNADVTPINLTLAANDTITELVAVINALAKGWVANVTFSGPERTSTDLWNIEATGCLSSVNTIDVEGVNTAYYEEIINQATVQIQNYCNREGFIGTGADETFYFDTNLDRNLFLPKYPIISITSVKFWDNVNDVAAETLTLGLDYTITRDQDILYRQASWSAGIKKVEVIGQFGYANLDAVPDDLVSACKQLSAYNIETATNTGYKSETIGKYKYDKASVSGVSAGIPDAIAQKLMAYKNYGRVGG